MTGTRTPLIRLALLAVLLMPLALLLRAPASLLNQVCAADHCRLAATQGTLWHGNGEFFVHTDAGWQRITRVDWEFSALWRQGALRWTLALDSGRATLDLRADGWTVQASGISLDAPPALALLAPALPAALPRRGWGGQLRLNVPGWTCHGWNPPGRCQGQASLNWQNAAQENLLPITLGSYHVEFQSAGDDSLKADLRSEQGPLMLAGKGELRPDSWSFVGETWADGPQQERLAPLLRPLGPLTASGHHALRFGGRR